MDNTKVLSYLQRTRLDDAEFQALVAAYRNLSDADRELLDAIILEFSERVSRYRLGVSGAFEVVAKVGRFMVKHEVKP